MKNNKGFTLAETLITLLVVGIVFSLLIGFLNVDNKSSVNAIKYRKIYDNLDVALKAKIAKASITGLNMAFTNDPDKMMDIISKDISTQEKFEGCKYDNLKTLIGDSACNSTNVKGAVLSDGTPISFIAENEATDLTNNLITKYGKSIQTGLVGALVVNNDGKTLDGASIIPVYENGLGNLEIPKKENVIVTAFIPNDNTKNKTNCEAIDHVWLNDECKTPSEDVCSEAKMFFYNQKCIPPTKDLCAAKGLIFEDDQCKDEKYYIKYREVYAALKQAYAQYNIDTNYNPEHLGGNWCGSLANMFAKYMKGDMAVVGDKNGNPTISAVSYSNPKKLNGNALSSMSGQGSITLKNGVTIGISTGHPHWVAKSPCQTWVGDYNGSLWIDVNGQNEAPNVLGRDIYFIFALHDDVYPWPLDTSYVCMYNPLNDWGTSSARATQNLTCNLKDSTGYGCSDWFLTHDKYEH